MSASRTREALHAMAREDPELGARLVLQTLPAAGTAVAGELTYDLTVRGLGDYRIRLADGNSSVTRLDGRAGDGRSDFHVTTDARGLTELAAGSSPLTMLLRRRLSFGGHPLRAMRLRALSGTEPQIEEVIRQGGDVDPDVLYRALPYMVDPEWTRGHRFVVRQVLVERGGEREWYLQARDGERLEVTKEPPRDGVDATVRVPADVYRKLLTRELTPSEAARLALTEIDGSLHAASLLGRWIERSQGRDDGELERERRQRGVQARRAGTWGSARNGAGADAAERRAGGELMSYEELYALWERQNWRAHELDFSVDREQWVTMPTESQEATTWSLSSFYIGEERVAADLAPFLLAAPSGEVEIFLATQLVDEARHAAFFDRFAAEVMALDAEDFRGRIEEVQRLMIRPWFDVFDDGLRDIANRIKERPDDLDLFVEGIATYHLVIEGFLAMTGQRFIIKYMEDHGIYPGFVRGFSLVEQDEHRHIAFGVRFLKEMVERDRRYGEIIERRVAALAPHSAYVFQPPYADDPSDFRSYGYHSSHVYGYAYRTLKRRMGVIGLEVPPPEEMMPGPIATPEEARAAGVPV